MKCILANYLKTIERHDSGETKDRGKTRERHEETAAAELPHECAPLEELGGTVSRGPGQRSAVR